MNKSSKLSIIPVMLCFFAMGFVDLVGIASNYVKEDLNLNDATANLFPSLVFFWFLIFSVPTGILMNKIGRKKTVLLSLLVDADIPEPACFRGDIRQEPCFYFDLWSVR